MKWYQQHHRDNKRKKLFCIALIALSFGISFLMHQQGDVGQSKEVPLRYEKSKAKETSFYYENKSYLSPYMRLIPNDKVTFTLGDTLSLQKGDILLFKRSSLYPYEGGKLEVGFIYKKETGGKTFDGEDEVKFQVPYDGTYEIYVENRSFDPFPLKKGSLSVQIEHYQEKKVEKQKQYYDSVFENRKTYLECMLHFILSSRRFHAISSGIPLCSYLVDTIDRNVSMKQAQFYHWDGGRLDPKESMLFCYPYDFGNGIELLPTQPIVIEYHLDRKTKHTLCIATPMGYEEYEFFKKDNRFTYYATEPMTTSYSFSLKNTSVAPISTFFIKDFSIKY